MEADLISYRAQDGRQREALANKPDLLPHLTIVWDWFWRLGTARPMGMAGSGAIPVTATMLAADEIGLTDPDERVRFFTLIEAMDRVILRHWEERRKRDRAAEEARGKQR